MDRAEYIDPAQAAAEAVKAYVRLNRARLAGDGELLAMLLPERFTEAEARDLAERRQAARADRGRRRAASRVAMLDWLYSRDASANSTSRLGTSCWTAPRTASGTASPS